MALATLATLAVLDGRPAMLLVIVVFAVLGLPGLGRSGTPAPAPPCAADLIAPAALLATWLLSRPAPPQVTILALAVSFPLLAGPYAVLTARTRGLPSLDPFHAFRVAVYPLLLAGGGLALAVRQPSVPSIALWIVAMVAYPVVLQRRQVVAAAHRSPGGAWRIVAALLLVAVLLPIVLGRLGSPGELAASDPAYGDPTASGEGTPVATYWGFGSTLDTSTRSELPDTEVLRVRADRPDYWRATSFDVWDGRFWTRSTADEAHVVPTPALSGRIGPQYLPTTRYRGPAGTTADLRQTFRVVSGTHGLLYAAATPTVIETPGLDVSVMPDATLRSSHLLGPGSQWTVQSTRAAVTDDDLRGLGIVEPQFADGTGLADGPTPESMAVPAIVPQRVRDLAVEITSGAATTYAKVIAIEAWLAANIEYTLSPPLPAEGKDAVDATLFEDRLGSCDQIAGAFAILARAVGIPARVAAGYTPHDYDGLRGEYVSRASDGHAWAEVWFGPAGWVAFDPTTDVPLAGEPAGGAALWRELAPWFGLLATAVIVGMLATWVVRRWARRRAAASDPHRLLRQAVEAYERGVAIRTRPRRTNETLVSYARKVTPVALHGRSIALAEGLSDAAFGPATTDLHDLRDATRELMVAWGRPSWRQRLRGRRALRP